MVIESPTFPSVGADPCVRPKDPCVRPSIPSGHPNLIFLGLFVILTAILTPLTLNAVNKDNKITLLSPIPPAGAIFPALPSEKGTIIAAPSSTESGKTQENSAATESNSTGNTFIFPAGTGEIEVYNPKVSGQSYIYLIPKTKTNSVVSVKSKSAGKFTATISPAEVTDLTIDYLLINQ